MNIEPKITVPVLVALLATAACTPAKPQKSEAIDRDKPSPSHADFDGAGRRAQAHRREEARTAW